MPRYWLQLATGFELLLASALSAMENALPISWRQGTYRLLGERQKLSSRTGVPRKIWTLAGLVAIVLFVVWDLGSPTAMSYQQLGERAICEHPVARLVHDAQRSFNATLERQSKSLEEAITEYRRRYGMPPPPHFDKWYEFAMQRGTVLIDEFDTIYHALLPFWGLTPSVIRSRVAEDLGNENHMMGVSIRNGTPIPLQKGQGEFQDSAAREILSMFGQWLPDMDLSFNTHDEPRVVVPHEELSRMVTKGRDTQGRLDQHPEKLRNGFSTTKVLPILEVWTSRFNDIERQETWLYSRLSCPPDTPVRDLDGNAPDNSSTYAVEPLGFVFNQTAASDMCLSPSLRHRLGVFEHPNAFKITNELTPVFSMSRPSSFQDIVIPSPWYYKEVTTFDPNTAVPWHQKIHDLYWRGGTNGGHSRGGSWRNLQRQFAIAKLTSPESAQYKLQEVEDPQCRAEGGHAWEVRDVNRTEFQGHFNTHFVDIFDCDDDCVDEEQFFGLAPYDSQEEAWRHRYLLDMDGHAYSGRFYALMRSASVPLKLTFFREWHENGLMPWIHYVPINKDAEEVPELIRFFEEDPEGQVIARNIGEDGQKWSLRALRNEDMEVYMFRLFLEYARVQDDNRHTLGFSLELMQSTPSSAQ